MKVTIPFVICVFCALRSHEAADVSSVPVSSDDSTSTSENFTCESLLGKLEDLEGKFWNMWLEMKEQNEQIMRKHSRLEDTHQGMMWMLTRLEQAVGHNFTTMLDRAWEIQQQQISCANHENWKESVLAMLPDKKSKSCPKSSSLPKLFKSCSEAPANKSGKYMIHPDGLEEPIEVYCEQKAFDGGWLVVQYRFDGSVDFYRNWTEYRDGFGSLEGEFWIGLEKLHRLTKDGDYQLAVELKNFDGKYVSAQYDDFEIGTADEEYSLKKLGSYSGTAGDSLSYHKGYKFSTMDNDHDEIKENCAVIYRGAWWYNNCYYSNLNGLYQKGDDGTHLNWYHIKANHEGLAYSRMMIRKI
nr:fibrinogen-like protein A [Aedes albopictus]